LEDAIFHDIQIVKELALETSTTTGLTVKVNINNKTYQTGRKVTDDFKENIIFDDQIPKGNYLITQN
jgi:hypothetical protein